VVDLFLCVSIALENVSKFGNKSDAEWEFLQLPRQSFFYFDILIERRMI
jgi:hypothetical protein